MAKIDIIMATFNGSAFIKQQILSIISQTFTDWRLLIHDDGSIDNTVAIIKSLASIDNRIFLIEDNCKFRSPGKNFMFLLEKTSSDLICFCDQDDIWFENKLSVLINEYKDSNIPTTIISSGYLYQTETNKIIGELDYRISNLRELLFVNGGIHGSRAMINKSLRNEMIKFKDNISMHDHLMSLISCSFGQIIYTDIPLFLYRQHSHNVTGNIEINPIKRIIRAFTEIDKKFLVSSEIFKCISDFERTYHDQLSSADLQTISNYLKIKDIRKIKQVFFIIKGKFSLGVGGRLRLIIKAATRRYSDK